MRKLIPISCTSRWQVCFRQKASVDTLGHTQFHCVSPIAIFVLNQGNRLVARAPAKISWFLFVEYTVWKVSLKNIRHRFTEKPWKWKSLQGLMSQVNLLYAKIAKYTHRSKCLSLNSHYVWATLQRKHSECTFKLWRATSAASCLWGRIEQSTNI